MNVSCSRENFKYFIWAFTGGRSVQIRAKKVTAKLHVELNSTHNLAV
jgi:hypothetical protein